MSKRANIKVITAGIETAYGTPSAVSLPVLASDIKLTPSVNETAVRSVLYPHYGAKPSVTVGEHASCEFSVEIAGSGTPGTPPAWGVLLRACGFAEIITAGVMTEYKPVSYSPESVTLRINMDDIRCEIPGARGTVSFEYAAKAFPVFKFKFTGKYVPVTELPAPAADYSAYRIPVAAGEKGNTSGLSFFGLSGLVVSKLSADAGISVVNHQTLTTQDILMTGREMKGSISMDFPRLSVKNFYSVLSSGETGALSFLHGKDAGNIIGFSAPKVQLTSAETGESDNIIQLDAGLSFLPDKELENDDTAYPLSVSLKIKGQPVQAEVSVIYAPVQQWHDYLSGKTNDAAFFGAVLKSWNISKPDGGILELSADNIRRVMNNRQFGLGLFKAYSAFFNGAGQKN
ncbi:hypothetical protein CHS0354_006815 [Potamilus streckersoni]|uniref:Uncharacterized protein n=1 Tax=Potamilus streckersoni TaxID=2493646 RepID=A0AAE0WC43_9BIVA|nr:hypothetical protein CHS0354_006815 [Potamilus streckersoni]